MNCDTGQQVHLGGRQRCRHFGIAAFLIAIVLVAYLPAMKAGFIWDDDAYVTANPLITAPDGLGRIWFSTDHPSQYFPMVYTVFRLEHKLWQFNPAGYHLVNIILHIINMLLLWQLLSRMKIPGAWLAAAMFGLHPVQVESVAWVTELKNVLMTVFFLLSVLAWLEFVRRSEQADRAWRLYILSLVLYVFALLSKTTAVTLPVALVLVPWVMGYPVGRKRWLQIIPYILLAVAAGLVTMWWEYRRGSGADVYDLNMIGRILVPCRALWFNAAKLFWPADLCFSYTKWKINTADPMQYLGLAGCLIFAIFLWVQRRKVGRGVIAAVTFFVATLLPTIGILPLYTIVYTYVADHYQYVACIGLFVLVSAGLYRIKEKRDSQARLFFWPAATAILLILAVLTWRQCRIYKDLETLWADTIGKNPSSLLANANMGLILESRGKIDEAIRYYRQAIETYPQDEIVNCNLGHVLWLQGKTEEALVHLQRSIELNPAYAPAHQNIALLFKSQGKFDDAVKHLQAAQMVRPNDAKLYYNLGNVFRLMKRQEESLFQYTRAIELEPNFSEAHNNIAVTLDEMGRTSEAQTHYQSVLKINPCDIVALVNLGDMFSSKGELDRAMIKYREAVKCDPQSADLLIKTARILMTNKNQDPNNAGEAAELLKRAAYLTGSQDPSVLVMLSAAYASAGRTAEAVAAAKSALDLALKGGDQQLAEQIKKQLQVYSSQ